VQVGDLVNVVAEGLRIPYGSLGLITRVEDREDSRGITTQYWANMAKCGGEYWFRLGDLEVISASR